MKEVLYEKFDVCQIIEVKFSYFKDGTIEPTLEFKNVDCAHEPGIGFYLIPCYGGGININFKILEFDYKRFLRTIRKEKKYYI